MLSKPLHPRDPWRTRFTVFLFTTIIVFIALAIMGPCLVIRFILPTDGWWGTIVPLIMSATAVPFLAALWIGVAATWIFDQYQHRRGLYQCARCGRILRRSGSLCECISEKIRLMPKRRRRSTWRHARRRIPTLLAFYAMLLPVALILSIATPAARFHSLQENVLFFELMLSAAILVVGELTSQLLEWAGIGRRLRLKWTVFSRMLALPLLLIFLLIK